MRKSFAKYGVGVNNAPCPTGSSGNGCTDVGGLLDAAIQQIMFYGEVAGGKPCDGGSSCKVIITGGSEPGYPKGTYSHANGYMFDIKFGSPLDALFKGFKSEGTNAYGKIYTDSCNDSFLYNPKTGNQYVKENGHWEIRITNQCNNPDLIPK